MRADLRQEFGHGPCARELDLAHGRGGGDEEFARVGFERVQGVQAVEGVEGGAGGGGERVGGGGERGGVQGVVEGFYDQVLRVRGGQAVEVD